MNKRILVVDDDLAIRESLKKLLDGAGYVTSLACDGQEGAASLEGAAFDLLLLDLDLPKVSGFDILEQVSTRHPLMPVIILTGLRDQCEPGAARIADALMEKPPDVSLLLSTIDKLLNESVETRLRRSSESLKAAGSASYVRLLTPEDSRVSSPWNNVTEPR